MFRNYVKVALRNLVRYKTYSLINVAGLAIGLACCILTLLWIQYEMSFDGFHENGDRLYRVIEQWRKGGDFAGQEWTPGPLGPALKGGYPEVVNSTRFLHLKAKQVSDGRKSLLGSGCAVDPVFFAMFSFPFMKGDLRTALSDPHSIVVSEELATKYFDTDDPLGKTLRIEDEADFRVTGVMKNVPGNSHFAFDFCVPYQIYSGRFQNWGDNNHETYVQLQWDCDYRKVSREISGVLRDHDPQSRSVLALQPLSRVHLYSLEGVSRITYVYMFSALALLVLLVACINYMNLSTARSAKRVREVGIRKTVGSSRAQLVQQFLGESVVLSFIAFCLGILLVTLVLPAVNASLGTELKIRFSWAACSAFFCMAMVTGIVSGSYPAFFLSAFSPIVTLKSPTQAARNSRSPILRKVLVIAQFSLSVFFIICVIVLYRQMNFMKSMDMGVSKDDIVLLDMRQGLRNNFGTVKHELLKNPDIVSVTAIDIPPLIAWNNTTDVVDWEGKNAGEMTDMEVKTVDYDFLGTFRPTLTAGRFFSSDVITDTSDAYIINETAARVMGMSSPLGKRLTLWSKPGTIIGVVKDFHTMSLHSRIEPLILRCRVNFGNYACVRLRPGVSDVAGTTGFMKNTIAGLVPDYPFTYKMLSDEYNALYENDGVMTSIILWLTCLTISISCMGLFSLSLFIAESSTKEISIRKIFGASAASIFRMLVKDFTKWILIANVIAWPLAYYAVHVWLRNFAYAASVGIWIFVFSGCLALIIALLTVSYTVVKTSRANPADGLRYE